MKSLVLVKDQIEQLQERSSRPAGSELAVFDLHTLQHKSAAYVAM